MKDKLNLKGKKPNKELKNNQLELEQQLKIAVNKVKDLEKQLEKYKSELHESKNTLKIEETKTIEEIEKSLKEQENSISTVDPDKDFLSNDGQPTPNDESTLGLGSNLDDAISNLLYNDEVDSQVRGIELWINKLSGSSDIIDDTFKKKSTKDIEEKDIDPYTEILALMTSYGILHGGFFENNIKTTIFKIMNSTTIGKNSGLKDIELGPLRVSMFERYLREQINIGKKIGMYHFAISLKGEVDKKNERNKHKYIYEYNPLKPLEPKYTPIDVSNKYLMCQVPMTLEEQQYIYQNTTLLQLLATKEKEYFKSVKATIKHSHNHIEAENRVLQYLINNPENPFPIFAKVQKEWFSSRMKGNLYLLIKETIDYCSKHGLLKVVAKDQNRLIEVMMLVLKLMEDKFMLFQDSNIKAEIYKIQNLQDKGQNEEYHLEDLSKDVFTMKKHTIQSNFYRIINDEKFHLSTYSRPQLLKFLENMQEYLDDIKSKTADFVGREKHGDPLSYEEGTSVSNYSTDTIPFGLEAIDRVISTGMKKGGISILAARASNGKTTAICNMALNSIMDQRKVAIISLETEPSEIKRKIVSAACSLSYKAIQNHSKKGTLDSLEYYKQRRKLILMGINPDKLIPNTNTDELTPKVCKDKEKDSELKETQEEKNSELKENQEEKDSELKETQEEKDTDSDQDNLLSDDIDSDDIFFGATIDATTEEDVVLPTATEEEPVEKYTFAQLRSQAAAYEFDIVSSYYEISKTRFDTSWISLNYNYNLSLRKHLDPALDRRTDEQISDKYHTFHVANQTKLNTCLNIYEKSSKSWEDIERYIRSKARYDGVEVIYIDYFSLITTKKFSMYAPKGLSEANWIVSAIKNLAQELQVTILIACQMNRNIEYREGVAPLLSDLKGTGDLEQVADSVIFLNMESNYANKIKDGVEVESVESNKIQPQTFLNFYIVKNRFGTAGTKEKMHMCGSTCSIYTLSPTLNEEIMLADIERGKVPNRYVPSTDYQMLTGLLTEPIGLIPNNRSEIPVRKVKEHPNDLNPSKAEAEKHLMSLQEQTEAIKRAMAWARGEDYLGEIYNQPKTKTETTDQVETETKTETTDQVETETTDQVETETKTETINQVETETIEGEVKQEVEDWLEGLQMIDVANPTDSKSDDTESNSTELDQNSKNKQNNKSNTLKTLKENSKEEKVNLVKTKNTKKVDTENTKLAQSVRKNKSDSKEELTKE